MHPLTAMRTYVDLGEQARGHQLAGRTGRDLGDV
jgi:hypothetical protein